MNKRVLLAMLLVLVGMVTALGQPEMSEEQLLGAMDFARFGAFFNPEVPTTTFTSEILAERPDGSKQAVVQVSFQFTEQGFLARIDYLSPEELAGDVFLISDEEIFFWNPDLIEPLKVNGRFEVFGDATVAEVIGIGFSGDYTIARQETTELEDGSPAIQLTLEANRDSVAFQQVRVVANAQTFQPVTLELFDESGDLLHFNTFQSYAEKDGKPYFERQLLDNRIVPVNQTLIIITNIESRALPDEMFDVNQLGQ